MNRATFLLAAMIALCGPQAWAQAAKPAPQPAAADPAAEAFKAWDKDKNGNLSLVEFRAGWQQVQWYRGGLEAWRAGGLPVVPPLVRAVAY